MSISASSAKEPDFRKIFGFIWRLIIVMWLPLACLFTGAYLAVWISQEWPDLIENSDFNKWAIVSGSITLALSKVRSLFDYVRGSFQFVANRTPQFDVDGWAIDMLVAVLGATLAILVSTRTNQPEIVASVNEDLLLPKISFVPQVYFDSAGMAATTEDGVDVGNGVIIRKLGVQLDKREQQTVDAFAKNLTKCWAPSEHAPLLQLTVYGYANKHGIVDRKTGATRADSVELNVRIADTRAKSMADALEKSLRELAQDKAAVSVKAHSWVEEDSWTAALGRMNESKTRSAAISKMFSSPIDDRVAIVEMPMGTACKAKDYFPSARVIPSV